MYKPRLVEKIGLIHGLKVYSIKKEQVTIDCSVYESRLKVVLAEKEFDQNKDVGFAIYHEGTEKYLVIVRWQNENEMLTSVSVLEEDGWVMDSEKYSFCLWDLEVFWYERNSYIKFMYSGEKDRGSYLNDFMVEPVAGGDATR